MLAAIDIGGTKIRLVTAESPLKIIEESVLPTPRDQATALEAMAGRLLRLAAGKKIQAIGIVSPGPLDKAKGLILEPNNFPWHNVAIGDYFKKEFNCPVALEHDATAGGIAEARYGAGKGSRVVLFITISTGIGTSIIVDGQPLPTKHNSEGGLVITQGKWFETAASGRAIARHYGKMARDIHSAKAWDEIAQTLAPGIFDLITTVEPDIVVLAGGVGVHYKKFIEPLKRHLAELKPLYPLPPIKQAAFVETAPIIGALTLAKDITHGTK
jgi:glucokinase